MWGFEDLEFGYRLMRNGHRFDIVENDIWKLHEDEAEKYNAMKLYGSLKNLEYFYGKFQDVGIMYLLQFYDAFATSRDPRDAWAQRVFEGFVALTRKLDTLHQCRTKGSTSGQRIADAALRRD